MKNLKYLVLASLLLFSCNKDDNEDKNKLDYILKFIFPVTKDKEFGQQFAAQLEANPAEYPLLPDTGRYHLAYLHLDSIRDAILLSDDLDYADDFDWPLKIVNNDEVLNAFCAPAGYIYFYTGIIKYLDNEAQLAGVMAHEMAHADKRHTTKTLLGRYAAITLIDMILGKESSRMDTIIADLALGLGALKFSRDHEYEADEMAVKYTADTDYHPKGIAGFFEKLEDEGNRPKIPEFLSTHPNPENRLEKMDSVYISIGSPPGELFVDRYEKLKSYLP